MTPTDHKKKKMLLLALVVLSAVLFCMVKTMQNNEAWEAEDAEVWGRRPPSQRHALHNAAQDKAAAAKKMSEADRQAEGRWFRRVRDVRGECRGQVHLVMQFPVLAAVDFRQEQKEVVVDEHLEMDARRRLYNHLAYVNSLPPVHRERRQAEYAETLRRNVANPYVKEIHLLMEREADKAFIVSQGVHDPCGKLKFVFLGKYLTYHDAIQYADEHLKGEMAMIMNCDVFLGEGFGALTRDHFHVGAKPHNRSSSEPDAATSGDQQKATTGSADEESGQQQQHGFKVYALSRYELTSPFCVEKKNEHCLARADISSLDAFLFLSPLPFNFSANVAELAIKQNTWGAENALVEAMREKGAVLKNPCHLLQLGHMHCDGKFRPNQGTYQGKAKIEVSDKLGRVGRAYEL